MARYGYGTNPYLALFLEGLQDIQNQRQTNKDELLALAANPEKYGYTLEPVAQPPAKAGFFGRLGGRKYKDEGVVDVGGMPFRLAPYTPPPEATLGDVFEGASGSSLGGTRLSKVPKEVWDILSTRESQVPVFMEDGGLSLQRETATPVEALSSVSQFRRRQGAEPLSSERIVEAKEATAALPPPLVSLPPKGLFAKFEADI
jgi:hypothetical protein